MSRLASPDFEQLDHKVSRNRTCSSCLKSGLVWILNTHCKGFSLLKFVNQSGKNLLIQCFITRDGWITNQSRLFGKVAKVLHADQLARLVLTEPIQRRLTTDKTAKRLRQIFASVSMFKLCCLLGGEELQIWIEYFVDECFIARPSISY